MSSPPITGNNDLDAYLYSLQLGIEATGTGTGTAAPTTINANDIVADYYPNQYMQVRYADDNVGTNISVDQANKKFYGLYNSNSFLASNNPADYTWFELTDTFGTDKSLFFTVLRGRNIKLIVSTVIPTVYWAECPTTYIDLDIISEGFLDNTDFQDGYEPVAIVNGLPNASAYTGPNIVYDTITNKMYRWQSGQWWSNVLAADIEGALGYANFSNSLRPVEVVSVLPTVGNFIGRVALLISDGKVYRYTDTGWSSNVPAVDLTGQITTTQITDGAIQTAKLAANAVTANEIAANAITAGKIATDAVTAGTIAAGAISADKLAANSVIAGKIAAGAVSATTIAAGAVSADKISVTNLSAISANLGTITGGSLNIASKFIVDSSGNATIKSSTTGERLEITNSTIRVYDAAGVVRVKIGNLA
jgi:hypothetical protein